jgi:hypothetical protein
VDNVEFVEAEMEAIPLPDGSVDAVISNGVINLSARKMRVLFECARVLRPGGRFCVTDITLDRDLPPEVYTHPAFFSGCVAGAMAERAFLRGIARVGLVDATVHERELFGVEDCARYPLFPGEFIDVMRRLIPPEVRPAIANRVTVSARKPPATAQDDRGTDLIASTTESNEPGNGAVFEDMSEHLPAFDAGDGHCGAGVVRDLRYWWAGLEPGTRTLVLARDPSAKVDLPSLARMLGHEIEHETETDGGLRLIVRTKGA